MADGLSPSVVDIQVGNVGQSKPDHAGPTGRLTSAVNCEVVQYQPAGFSTGPQKNTLRQRPGFASLPTEIRSIIDGGTLAEDFSTPQLLSSIGDQLVSIAHSLPRVYNGLDYWVQHNAIALTQELSEKVIHTTNKVVQAPDSAWLNGVECFTWQETDSVAGTCTSYVGFRAEGGEWLVQPRVLSKTAANEHTLARVIVDPGLSPPVFWVFHNEPSTTNFRVRVYDVTGTQLATALTARLWSITPGFYDVSVCRQLHSAVEYTAALVQPGGWSSGEANEGLSMTIYQFDGVSTINQFTGAYSTSVTHCSGPLGILTKQGSLPSNTLYVATVGEGDGDDNGSFHAYEITDTSITHTYDAVATTVRISRVDGITGYAEEDAFGVRVGIAISQLAHGPFMTGPPYDPALRAVTCWEIEPTAAFNLKVQHNGVLLQSRAFQIDDHWHAVTYYQSGPGLLRSPAPIEIDNTEGDYFIGAPSQPITVSLNDSFNGAAHLINSATGLISQQQAIGSTAHNAGDSVVGASATWILLNNSFTSGPGTGGQGIGSAVGSLLTISGATPSSLNTTWRIVSVLGAHTVITERIGGNGTAIVDSSLAGSTWSLVAATDLVIPVNFGANGQAVEANVAGLFIGGSVTVSGALHSGNNNTYTIREIKQDFNFDNADYSDSTIFVCDFAASSANEVIPSAATMTLAPATPVDAWRIAQANFTNQVDVGATLSVDGAGSPGVSGDWVISSCLDGVYAVTVGPLHIGAYLFSGSELMSIQPLASSTTSRAPYTFFLQAASFTQADVNGFVTLSGSAYPANNGTYRIVTVIDSHTIVTVPANGATGQRSEELAGAVVILQANAAGSSPNLQPTWFIQPLDFNQQTVGRFENGLAFGDWRFDADAFPNYFMLGLCTAFLDANDGTIRFTLPYRAQSTTGGQTVTIQGTSEQIPDVLQTTVGLKDFTIAVTSGDAHTIGKTLLIPGPQAFQYTLTGFTENGVNLGFEVAFEVTQTLNAGVVGITPGSKRQYIIVAECTDENGDRVFSTPSQALDVQLAGTNNQIQISGRLIGPTNRNVAISIYATAWNNGIQTTEHHKITNDLDINGLGFSFSTQGYNYSGAFDTWAFTDNSTDAGIQSHEVLYTDKGLLPRSPAPAFSKAATWQGRIIVLGYDGALWISGDPTEGDAVWFHPGLRVFLPIDADPSNIVSMDDYLMVLAPESFFYLPTSQLPDNTGQNGSLPSPVQIQFQGGCPGPAVGSRDGVVYFNPESAGAWLISRGLANTFFSEDIRTDLTPASNVTALRIDGQQRLYLSVADLQGDRLWVYDQVSTMWWRWDLPSAPLLLATWRGKPVYQDDLYVMAQSTARFDVRNGVQTGAPPSYVFSSLNFAGIRSFKRLWAMQLVGKWKGPHNLTAEISYPDEFSLPPTEFSFTPAGTVPYVYEINPEEECASSYGLTVGANFAGIAQPGDSFEFEVVSCEVGVLPGINRTPDSNRKAAT